MQTALVTGATSGIGREIALRLSSSGYQVISLGRNEAALSALATHPHITPLAVDLTDREQLTSALAGYEVDLLVNNAGIMCPLGPFHEISMDDIEQIIKINIQSHIMITKLLAPTMIRKGCGHIFFTGSTAGHHPFANMAIYCASKAAISAYAQAIRCDLAGSGVRVTEIVAGRTETALYEKLLSEEQRLKMYDGDVAVTPENIADMIQAVLSMPPHVDVARFDILPNRQTVATGNK